MGRKNNRNSIILRAQSAGDGLSKIFKPVEGDQYPINVKAKTDKTKTAQSIAVKEKSKSLQEKVFEKGKYRDSFFGSKKRRGKRGPEIIVF
jgi:hypothetical protein